MCDATMNNHLQELARLRMMKTELEELITHEEDELKQYMQLNQLSELIGMEHKATYKSVTSSRLDTTALKKELPDVAARFMRSSSSMRFTFS